MTIQEVYYRNALAILEAEADPRIAVAYKLLRSVPVTAGIEDWILNPFVSTALSILKKFSSYKVQQAIKLIEEAATEAREEKTGKKKKGK